MGDLELKVAVVNGLVHAKQLLADIEAGTAYYDLIEVMTCKGGRVGGAGQPYGLTPVKEKRADGLYEVDRNSLIKRSERNPIAVKMLETLPEEKVHELFHVHYKH